MTNVNFGSAKNMMRSALVSAVISISGLGISLGTAIASPINVNTASQSELESIKGIGPSKAKTIIAERQDGGHFQDANDLQKRVRGIGMRSVEKMVDNGLTIESPSSFREPNGRTQKEGGVSGRRHSRNQGNGRNSSERAAPHRRN
ncbi:DNA-binding protein [Polynucleobacter tropicus]|uniref:DNA-binding protein n=1 Tax=Polynucleobacter tropicus TaxID=1743174 RepID=A0A6M9Q631_9BURK|nr:helix-hairpin-helix domain-containing protein [Polynucleobacter tropicus]QKM64203.1 DNA-binding protein [Polynucleobacter tropicus]